MMETLSRQAIGDGLGEPEQLAAWSAGPQDEEWAPRGRSDWAEEEDTEEDEEDWEEDDEDEWEDDDWEEDEEDEDEDWEEEELE